MTVHVMEVKPVPPNQGDSLGTVTYDDATGKLVTTGIATSIFRKVRFNTGDDRTVGDALVKGGWSNGQLYLVRSGG